MARINGSGFKMKRTPVKGRLGDFFSSLGKEVFGKDARQKRVDKQLESKKGTRYEGMTSMEAARAEKKSRKAGESKFQADVRRRKETNKAKRSMVDKDKDGMSDLIQAPKKAPKGKETVSTKPKSKGNYSTFSGKKGDKFKYRYRSQGPSDKPTYDFQRPGSDVWEVPKTEAGTRVIQDLWREDYEGKNYEVTPIQKRSKGFKMPRYGKRK